MKYFKEIIISDLIKDESWSLSKFEIGVLVWMIEHQIDTHNELLDTQPYKRAEWSKMLEELKFLEKLHESITGRKRAV
tara:strand:- start:526 stop:759 length:234 start_codon:yes stop_codon:yes gene_type:complete